MIRVFSKIGVFLSSDHLFTLIHLSNAVCGISAGVLTVFSTSPLGKGNFERFQAENAIRWSKTGKWSPEGEILNGNARECLFQRECRGREIRKRGRERRRNGQQPKTVIREREDKQDFEEGESWKSRNSKSNEIYMKSRYYLALHNNVEIIPISKRHNKLRQTHNEWGVQ